MTGAFPDAPAPPLTALQRILLVFVGGSVGTAIRAGLGLLANWGSDAQPADSSIGAVSALDRAVVTSSITTFSINIVGAFLLGYLLELLRPHLTPSGAPPDLRPIRLSVRRAQALRLGLGTGMMGGFTTYSALAVDTAIIGSTNVAGATIYALATLLVGALASAAGIAVASAWERRRQRGEDDAEGDDR